MFFTVIDVDPIDVRRRHVLEFICVQRTGSTDSTVVPIDSSEGLALSTIRRRLSSLAGFYSHLVAVGELDHNPVQRGLPVRSPVTRDRRVIPLVRPVRHLPRILDHDDVINIDDLSTERGHRTLAIVREGGKHVTIPIAPRTGRALDLYIGERTMGPIFLGVEGGRMDRYCADRMVKRLVKQAGIDKRISPHSLRHSFITAALDAGVPLRDVQEAASHADPRTTMRYDRARRSLDRHATYIVSTFIAGATRPG